MTEFEFKIKATRDYLDYVENHYNNVQKAFKEFTRRTCNPICSKKYDEFMWQTKLYDDYSFFVLEEMIKNHDLSKLNKEEFTQYRDNFFPLNEEAKKANKEEFEKAWEHHKQVNAHHWQSRVDKKYNENLPVFLRELYIIENVMDWIAMAYAFNETPINKYYLDNKHKMQLSGHDTLIIEDVYNIMLDKDLEEQK